MTGYRPQPPARKPEKLQYKAGLCEQDRSILPRRSCDGSGAIAAVACFSTLPASPAKNPTADTVTPPLPPPRPSLQGGHQTGCHCRRRLLLRAPSRALRRTQLPTLSLRHFRLLVLLYTAVAHFWKGHTKTTKRLWRRENHSLEVVSPSGIRLSLLSTSRCLILWLMSSGNS